MDYQLLRLWEKVLTLVNLPNPPGIYRYFKPPPNLCAAAETFNDVLAFIVLDSASPPTS